MLNREREPEPGRYQHYKGGEYEVVATATDAVLDGRVVVYRDAAGRWWTRSVRAWNLPRPDGKPRFSRAT